MKKIVKFLFAFILGLGLVSSNWIIHQQGYAETVKEKEYVKVLKKAKKQARQGKVINSEFAIGTAKQLIVKKYGQPDKGSTDEALYYEARHLAFSLQHQKVSRITTQDPKLLKVTKAQVKEILGNPDRIEGAAGHLYWTYKIGKYELTFDWQNVDPEIGKLLSVTVDPAS
jgi:hypothetical protein